MPIFVRPDTAALAPRGRFSFLQFPGSRRGVRPAHTREALADEQSIDEGAVLEKHVGGALRHRAFSDRVWILEDDEAMRDEAVQPVARRNPNRIRDGAAAGSGRANSQQRHAPRPWNDDGLAGRRGGDEHRPGAVGVRHLKKCHATDDESTQNLHRERSFPAIARGVAERWCNGPAAAF